MKKIVIGFGAILVLALLIRLFFPGRTIARSAGATPRPQAASSDELDRLLAPVALYPDQLLGQMLLCAQNPGNVEALNLWMTKNPTVKGTDLQDAVANQGFDPSFVTLALFPQVVKMMSDQLDWTTNLGVAFTSDRSAVFASIQRLRMRASEIGTLKTNAQQEVETRTTSGGEQVIVIEPANPQVVYVPQYNTTTVYTQAPTSTTVIVESDNSAEVMAAGMIGFTAGVVIGAAFSNPYYYGPHGWYGGAYMYNDAWDDYWDHREDAREDWTEHREDIVEERSDRASNAQEQRTERQENRQENRPESQQQRTERQQTRQDNRPESQAQRQQRSADAQAASQRTRSSSTPSAESRGYSGVPNQQARESSARSSDAFSGYSSGRSERSASSRGQSSQRSSSRSRSGGGGRRR
jgi:hypothetical protein